MTGSEIGMENWTGIELRKETRSESKTVPDKIERDWGRKRGSKQNATKPGALTQYAAKQDLHPQMFCYQREKLDSKRRLSTCRIFERARGCVSPLSDARAVATPGETAPRVESGARGDARRRRDSCWERSTRPRDRRRWAMKLWRRAPPLDAAGTGQPTRRRNTVGGSRLCSYSFSQRLLHES
ncbi:hypothetical protein EVAR_99613_1 [Eumeta japonica]|uniref:Uncharacterized protein n=1 Tax=Eumeta variegata TaxID=151549 RepID=A0A4C1SYT6_EUMVA|nr:hypothetical protein EVAR_99613_1 [Eumeta japonica]